MRLRLLAMVIGASLPGCGLLEKDLDCDDDEDEEDGECVPEDDDDDDDRYDDSGDSDGRPRPETEILSWNYNCSEGSTCTFTATAAGDAGTLFVEIIESGDPAWSCGPEKGVNNDCGGVWYEQFTAAGAGAYRKTLQVVTDYRDQVNGTSTLFGASTIDRLTFFMLLSDSSGGDVDCAAGGDDPRYYAAYNNLTCDAI